MSSLPKILAMWPVLVLQNIQTILGSTNQPSSLASSRAIFPFLTAQVKHPRPSYARSGRPVAAGAQSVRSYKTWCGFHGRIVGQEPFNADHDLEEPAPAAKPLDIPDYLNTKDGHYAGPTPTGHAPYLAQTNLAPFPGVSHIPNTPLVTQIPIAGNINNNNIFQSLGILSPYFPNPRGFGVNEYPLPSGSKVSWLNMVHRHGSRYPEEPEGGGGAEERNLGRKISDAAGNFVATGPMAFLHDWEFMLGAEILVPNGKAELFNSGTLHYYQYGHLYPNNGSKIMVRTTTQRRMVESAEYFLAGFFGLGWTDNATLVLGIEHEGFNNTLAGYKKCRNHDKSWVTAGLASRDWVEVYLKDAHRRISSNITGGLDWTIDDTYHAQSLCAYETVALGFSGFCGLFTYDEWEGYEYSLDIAFSGAAGFGSPVGRAIGVGYVQEVLARMRHQLPHTPSFQLNTTLDNSTETFPTTQTLNLDFSHDSNIISILAAFGLTQFAETLPVSGMPPSREFIMSHLMPFAGRLDIEIIEAPQPVNPDRSVDREKIYMKGGPTKYVHLILNQRTVPLGTSHKACGKRDDGWCEMETFLAVMEKEIEEADFDYACFGDYETPAYGEIKHGRPMRHGKGGKGE